MQPITEQCALEVVVSHLFLGLIPEKVVGCVLVMCKVDSLVKGISVQAVLVGNLALPSREEGREDRCPIWMSGEEARQQHSHS